MLSNKDKISLRQAILLFCTLYLSSAIRFMPSYAAREAKQAAWLSPLVSLFAGMLIFLTINWLINCYKKSNSSFIDIICDILGKVPGKLIIILYTIYIIIPISLFTRYYAERISATIFPNADIKLVIFAMLALSAYVLKSGIVTLARMNEIIFSFFILTFVIIMIFILPNLNVKNLTPVSYIHIFPVIRGSLGISAVFGYIIYFFFIDNYINNKEKIIKIGFQVSIFLTLVTSAIITMTVGAYGYTVVKRLPLPFLSSVKLISVFDILEKVESIVVILWVSTDFILISSLIYIFLNLMKSIFMLRDINPLINMSTILLFFTSLFICQSKYELEDFSSKIASPAITILGILVPVLILLIGILKKFFQSKSKNISRKKVN